MASLNANLHFEDAVDEDIFFVEVNDNTVPKYCTLGIGKYPHRVTVFCTLTQLTALRKEIKRAFVAAAHRSGDR